MLNWVPRRLSCKYSEICRRWIANDIRWIANEMSFKVSRRKAPSRNFGGKQLGQHPLQKLAAGPGAITANENTG